MAPKKSAAKTEAKRKADAVEEETPAPTTPEVATSLVPVASKKQPLDRDEIKRFKSHAGYNSTKASLSDEDRQFASRALQLYANGTNEQKSRILCSFRSDKTYKWTNTFLETKVDAVSDKDSFASGWMT